MTSLSDQNKAKALDDLKKFYGRAPYDGGSNIVRGDGYFARSIEKRYGMSIPELARVVGLRTESDGEYIRKLRSVLRKLYDINGGEYVTHEGIVYYLVNAGEYDELQPEIAAALNGESDEVVIPERHSRGRDVNCNG